MKVAQVISFARTVAVAVVIGAALASPLHAFALRNSPSMVAPAISAKSFVQQAYPVAVSVTGAAVDYFISRDDYPASFSFTSFVAIFFTGSSSMAGVNGGAGRGLMPNSFALGSLAPGDQIRLNGLALESPPGVESYSKVLRLSPSTASAPDPEIWAMVLVSVGLIGMRLRRKSRLDSARRLLLSR